MKARKALKAIKATTLVETVKNARFIASGSYGSYAKNGKYGVKVIARSRYTHKESACSFTSKGAVLQHPVFAKAKKEALLLKKAGKLSKLPPKFYGVGAYKIGRRWFAGIIMEHINGYNASSIGWRKQNKVIDKVKGLLADDGINYKDGNEDNYVFDTARKAWRVIDFSPGWVKFFNPD